ncbi:MAG: HNH endonuclease, partial [Candidatus Eisenbacteria bacterium]
MLQSRRVSRLPSPALLAEFTGTLARDRGTTVDLLIQIGEIEARRLYVGKACADMYAYCTQVLHMSESTATRRIRAAQAARRFPVILPMIAEGKLHLSAVSLLAKHLKAGNVAELLAEATHKSKAEVERMVARRFPKPDVATSVRALDPPNAVCSPTAQVVANIAAQLSPVTVVPMKSSDIANSTGPLLAEAEGRAVRQVVAQVVSMAAASGGSEPMPEQALARIADAVTHTIVSAAATVAPAPDAAPERVTPRSAGRYAWQLTADQEMQDLFEEARDLIGHADAHDLAAVLKRGLRALVETLRKARYAATSKPRATPANANGRHVPHAVVRAVVARDGGQCTFVSPDGRRCTERKDLQLDHVIPFARGGKTTVENLRQMCPAHNQYEAERVFGRAHMDAQREA